MVITSTRAKLQAVRGNFRHAIGAAAAVLLLAVLAFVLAPRDHRSTDAPAAPALPKTIERSGKIAGIAIGMPMSEVRAKLDPLRAPQAPYEPDVKEKTGRRIYWKLQETEYDWLMAWANEGGNVTRVRAVFRPEHRKRFEEIGDLTRAITASPSMVRWNLHTPNGAAYRLTAQGSEQLATSVYMFSQEVPVKEHQEQGEDAPATR